MFILEKYNFKEIFYLQIRVRLLLMNKNNLRKLILLNKYYT